MTSKIKSIFSRLNRRDLPLIPKINFNKYSKIVFLFLAIASTVFITKAILAQESTEEVTTEDTTTEITESSSTTQETEVITPVPMSAETIQEFQAKQDAMEQGNNQESWMKESVGSNAMVGINVLSGTIPSSVLEGKVTSWLPGGLIGLTSKSIAMLYDIPVSGVEYLAHVKDNFFGKSTYAKNEASDLSPLIPLWKGFRNITYTLFSVIFVVIGILIMLRVKISPQAVINIQNAIPKLITSLVLVTFSYAIVGLLIDFSYVIAGLGISVVSKASGFNYNVIQTINHPLIAGKMFGLFPFGAITIIAGIVGGLLALIPVVGIIVGPLAFIIIFLIASIVILVQVFKFFIGLIKCYLTVLLKTIIAPLEIAIGAIPNMKMGFNTWFIDVFANVMVFPITLIFLVLAEIIMTTVRKSSGLWTPPGLAFLLSGGDIIAIVIGIGALTLVAKMPKLIPEFIFQIKPSPYGKAIGDSLGAGWNSFAKSAPVGYAKEQAKDKAGGVVYDIGRKLQDHKSDAVSGVGSIVSRMGENMQTGASINDLYEGLTGKTKKKV